MWHTIIKMRKPPKPYEKQAWENQGLKLKSLKKI
jgi:hypothetical protein